MTAQLDVLVVGYADDRVASTCTLLRDGDVLAVVDPGMVARRSLLTEPPRAFGIAPDDITDVVISHHHPDHTMLELRPALIVPGHGAPFAPSPQLPV